MEQLRESLTREELIKEFNVVVDDDEQLKIDEYLKNYFEIKSQIDKLTEALKVENKKIVDILTTEYNTKKYIGDEYSATVAYKESIKYNDEKKIMGMIRNDFSEEDVNKYIIQVIDTKAFNELLKNSPSTAEMFKDTYTKTPSTSLTVKKI